MAHKRTGVLTHTVAVRVVDTIAPRIDYPLNIMDERGIIIASSDPKRVGNLHPDALKALGENRTIFTHHADPATGQQPGVNVPLLLDGALQGVVGVTGTPKAVAPLAQLISLTVQLLLTQQEEHVRDTLRTTVASEMLSGLVSGTSSAQMVAEQLDLLEFPKPWSISLLRPQDGQPLPSFGDKHAVLAVNNALWVLSSSGMAPKASEGALRSVVGTPRDDAAQLLVDAENWRTLDAYPALIPRAASAEFWDADLALAAARTPAGYSRTLAARIVKLSEEHARTLLALATSASHVDAAERLNVHRNTLIQRMERIKLVTGCDPRIPGELLSLLGSVYASVKLGELHIF